MSILDKKMPSLLGIAVIATGILATTFLVKGERGFQINAGPGEEPKNIEISNATDTSFTVTFVTDDSTIGSINVGENDDNLNLKFLDDRDKASQTVNKSYSHSITATGLKPETTYYYTVSSGDKTVKDGNSSFSFKTAPVISEINTNENSISGNAVNPDGSTPNDGIVIVKISGAQILSTILEKDGSYSLSLNNIRTSDLNNSVDLDNKLPATIDVMTGLNNSQISLSTDQLSNIPLVTLSNNYDFTDSSEETVRNNRQDVKFPEFNNSSRPRAKITPTKLPQPTTLP